ncbi:RNA-binding domain-containing protein [Phanerochaete sordida]|uniref:RNA-binding domain-containing protein n=1 Tax=Phanerochaete sordida TaxID=48140 RepID=A0A9P3L6J9_9APHY|nr:RNA-binding domain-containing protein [Phanerochaete sordida]
MSTRGRSTSPHPLHDADVEMDTDDRPEKPHAKVIVVTNLTRNVVEAHLQTIFSFYGEITKIDLPLFGKSGQNRGKASLEFLDSASAHRAASHMNGGQLDGAILKVELSELPVRSRSRSPRPPPRNGRGKPRSFSRSPSRSRSPPRRAFRPRDRFDRFDRFDDHRPRYGRRGPPPPPPPRDTYRPRSRTRSRSPVRRGDRLPPRRRSPSYERGGTGAGYRRRSRSRSYSVVLVVLALLAQQESLAFAQSGEELQQG